MRSFLFLIPAVVRGCETALFTDELCSVASTGEVEFKSSSSGTEVKTTVKHEGTMAWIPGACLVFGTPYKIETKVGDLEAVKEEIPCTLGLAGHGNFGTLYIAYGKDIKDCADFTYKKQADKTPLEQLTTWKVKTSGGNANVCDPANSSRHTKVKDNDYFTKTTCGPVPAAVWGIVLGSLGIVFSFAGLGLAAAAGK